MTDKEFFGALEAYGQKEMVVSGVLPVEGDWGVLEAWGVRKVEGSNDPLFHRVTLPEGWTIRPDKGRSMWSGLYDDRGRERASIFYKAAFYDRRAYFHVSCLYRYVAAYNDSGDMLRYEVERGGEVVKVVEVSCEQEYRHVALRAARATAVEWLNTNVPRWEDPLAYWDE